MADFQNAGYRLLSFQYHPVKDKQDERRIEGGEGKGANPTSADGELPSLSSLMTSLQEIEDSDDTQKHQASTESKSSESDASSVQSAAAALVAPLNEFHLFGDLPTELRLKIWNLSFLPRVVELRPTRPNYSPAHDDGRRPQVSHLWPAERADPSPPLSGPSPRFSLSADFSSRVALTKIYGTPVAIGLQ